VKRVLLIGGSGQLGTAIRQRWTDCEIVAPPHHELDIRQADRLEDALARIRPDFLVNASAFHDVDRCEAEPAPAFEINAIAVGAAARLAREAGARFVTFSTDYVFDGAASSPYTERDAPHPLSVYGASKLAGEHLVDGAHARAFVVRTSGVYGAATSASRRRPFIERVLSADRNGAPVRVVADVCVSPTFAGDLADALRRLTDTEAYGLYHVVNAGQVSWYEFARDAVRQAGVDVPLEPIAATAWKAQAVRPRFSALSPAKLAGLGISLPSWREGIAAYLGVSQGFG
jgi:dTDP-4-dehydrorhamnose reductase